MAAALRALSTFDEATFAAHLPTFFPLLTALMRTDHAPPEVRGNAALAVYEPRSLASNNLELLPCSCAWMACASSYELRSVPTWDGTRGRGKEGWVQDGRVAMKS